MKNLSALFAYIFVCMLTACGGNSGSGTLFDGKDHSQWTTTGDVSVKNQLLVLSGSDAKAVLTNGKYKNFHLSMDVRTTPGGKGYVAFHTTPDIQKGYRVSINNDREDPQWWKMSGSLLSVRNLTKSFVKENDWFTIDIQVEGNFISVDINGEPVVEYIEPASPYRIKDNAQALLSQGTFAIVSEGQGEIQLKNITVTAYNESSDAVTQGLLARAINEQTDHIIKLHQEDFPVLDYHVHLKGGLTKEVAAAQSRRIGINYAIAPNCGIGFPITNDLEVMEFLDSMRTEPFILAMQAEGREWIETFSPEVRAEFDYVFTDALTFTDRKGRRTRLWIPEETWIDGDEQDYMDLIVEKICDVLQEPMDIYVNPCFLPEPMDKRYDELWTEARMNKFVDALAKSGKALEINDRYEIPNKAIIQKAKNAGVKFTFGTNNVEPEVGKLDYCIRMKNECGLTSNDMFKPKIKI